MGHSTVNKISNEYADILKTYPPKAVIAGITVSLLMRVGEVGGLATEEQDEINKMFMEEWRILYENGIIPQKPKKKLWICKTPKKLRGMR